MKIFSHHTVYFINKYQQSFVINLTLLITYTLTLYEVIYFGHLHVHLIVIICRLVGTYIASVPFFFSFLLPVNIYGLIKKFFCAIVQIIKSIYEDRSDSLILSQKFLGMFVDVLANKLGALSRNADLVNFIG